MKPSVALGSCSRLVGQTEIIGSRVLPTTRSCLLEMESRCNEGFDIRTLNESKTYTRGSPLSIGEDRSQRD
jgi:hypothetical protein